MRPSAEVRIYEISRLVYERMSAADFFCCSLVASFLLLVPSTIAADALVDNDTKFNKLIEF